MTRLEIIAFCLVVPPALELLPANRVFGRLAQLRRRRGDATPPERLAGAVDHVMGRLPWIWRRTCLRRATVLAALLRREGREAEVVIGVRRSPGGELEAHAWVSCDGVEPFLEAESDPAFSVLRHAPSTRP